LATNENSDAMTTLSIAWGKAKKAEDWESVLEIEEMMKEADSIAANLPLVGFSQAEYAKFKAAVKSSETDADYARKKMKETEEEVHAPGVPIEE